MDTSDFWKRRVEALWDNIIWLVVLGVAAVVWAAMTIAPEALSAFEKMVLGLVASASLLVLWTQGLSLYERSQRRRRTRKRREQEATPEIEKKIWEWLKH